MSLYISMNIPGSNHSDSAINNAITLLASYIAIEKHNGNFPDEPALDITFMIPGRNEKPGFSGMRMGGYTQDSRILYFETAVPEHITQSDKAPDYVTMVLHDMVDNAEIFFDSLDFSGRKVNFNAEHWRTILSKISSRLYSNTRH